MALLLNAGDTVSRSYSYTQPSPLHPSQPSETGERTGNLFDESLIQNGYYGSIGSISVFTIDDRYRAFSMAIKAGTYTIKIQADEGIRLLRIATTNEFYNVQEDNKAYTFVISADATMYVSWRNLQTTNSFTNMTVMLNTGSTALPYEPYGYKLPITSGNTTTNVYLSEPLRKIGEYADEVGKTENLWGVPIVQGAVSDTGDLINLDTRVRGEYIPVQSETQYTISCNKAIRTIYAYQNKGKVGAIYGGSSQTTTITFTTPANCDSICVGFMNNPNTAIITPSDIEFVMLNSGSTAKPYQPYGYAVTRYIKKLVLTGEEEWFSYSITNIWQFHTNGSGIECLGASSFLSNITPYGMIPDTRRLYEFGCCGATAGNEVLFQMYGARDVFTNIAAWKAFLAQQYANGTPVTVWYVLATPTSESIEAPTIPTVKGSQTFDVETTLKPSEVELTYKGWHPHEEKKRENGEWS